MALSRKWLFCGFVYTDLRVLEYSRSDIQKLIHIRCDGVPLLIIEDAIPEDDHPAHSPASFLIKLLIYSVRVMSPFCETAKL